MSRTTPTTITRQARASAATVVAVCVLAGCSSSEPPSELPVPDVTWPDSAMAYDLEASRWVQIVREAEVLASVAWNHLDYSDPDLIAAWGYDTVVDTLLHRAELRYTPGIYDRTPEDIPSLRDWGPNPIVPYSVEETPAGATVTACAVRSRSLGTGEIASVEVRHYEIREVQGGTQITFEHDSDLIGTPAFDWCRTNELEEARFDPQPTIPPDASDGIKPPADREVYEELQARDE